MTRANASAGAFLFAAALLLVPASAAPAQGDVTAELRKEDFFREGLAPVRKPASYDLTIVYFMDYQCPACRQYTPDVARALKEEKKVRVIYRDTPIFGPRSEAAARAAIASHFQGRHEAMHQALMTAPLPLDDAAIRNAARKAGVDWARLQRDLDERKDEITSVIDWNQHLSVEGGISGTPAFIIGDRLADGAMKYADLRASIADARREAGMSPDEVSTAPVAGETADRQPNTETPAGDAAEQTPQFYKAEAVPETPLPAGETPERRSGFGTAGLLAVPALALLATAILLRRRGRRRPRL